MRRRAAALSVVPYAQERTDAHKNIALSYALFKFANFVMPYYASFWNDTLHNLGLEVDNSNVDPTSPVGVGNLAGPPALLAGSAVGCFSTLLGLPALAPGRVPVLRTGLALLHAFKAAMPCALRVGGCGLAVHGRCKSARPCDPFSGNVQAAQRRSCSPSVAWLSAETALGMRELLKHAGARQAWLSTRLRLAFIAEQE